MNQEKLAFVIAGAQKSGTTTLDAILRHHPQIQMAAVKETHFFDDEQRDWESPDYRALHAYFPAEDSRIRGEASPVTMYWRPAVRRLQRYNPDVRLLVILRDPVMRAFSNWRHEQAHGREVLPFAEAIRGGRERVREQGTEEGLHRYVAYVERGFYAEQLSYLCRYFPKQNIHCEIHEEFFVNRAAALGRVAAFLSVAPFPGEISDLHLNPSLDSLGYANLKPADVSYLSSIYSEQIIALEEFLGRPIPAWQAPARALRLATAR